MKGTEEEKADAAKKFADINHGARAPFPRAHSGKLLWRARAAGSGLGGLH